MQRHYGRGSVTGTVVVITGSVATVDDVGGTKVDDVGGWVLEVVSSGGGGAWVVVGCGGGWVVAVVPLFLGAVVGTEPWVVGVADPFGVEVVLDPMVDEVDVEAGFEVVGNCTTVVFNRKVDVVVEAAWVATCCLSELSEPVATSNSRATRATDARAYSPTLKR